MSVVRHLVSPRLPTALAGDTHVDLPGHDLCFVYVSNVHVIPTELDVSKFEDALSRVLQLYPHAAGRLQCDGGRWSIELTNTPVPVDVEYKLDAVSDSFLDESWVIQADLSPFLNQHPFGVDLAKGDAPLLRLKLTLLDHETCIGISWNHSLGDAIAISRLIHALSQYYQGLPLEFAAPSFKKCHFPTLSDPMLAELLSRIPSHALHHFDQVAFAELLKDIKHVKWHVDSNELEKLRSTLSADKQNGKYLSRQDCLTAYLVAVLNRHSGKPLQTVRNVSSYRHVQAPFITENVASNLLVLAPVRVPTDMAGIAGAIRGVLLRAREPDCVFLLESAKSTHYLEGDPAHPSPFAVYTDELFVNSHAVIDWCGAHFGFPDGTRFHTSGYANCSVRCFKSNPARGEDGVWRPRQSTEISMGVPAALEPKIMETLGQGIQYMLDNQHVH